MYFPRQTFDSFLPDGNRETVDALRRLCASSDALPSPILLLGEPGTGKTHLLRAVKAQCGDAAVLINGEELLELCMAIAVSAPSDRPDAPVFVPDRDLLIDDFEGGFYGDAIRQVFLSLINELRRRGHFVLCSRLPTEKDKRVFARPSQVQLPVRCLFLRAPDAAAQLGYVKQLLAEYGLPADEATVRRMVGDGGKTVRALRAAVRELAARTAYDLPVASA